ncbi:MAG: di-trans,poly-cis-decaprenylcistransferase [Candidatus Lloydbacteria bacterium RIFCSPHIGHO2_01_FULL_49_22]|uniref:Isoprenyl transferase n=1 Tax=Candidatus Lloydbacteria bacterium RIFCSPHIGHO2_01_FULL_49_22 TaxID=1798658 RepID=A0A1G2CVR4_9BACT|nr:MAG: di-trans,poly-cis-decaprenylcistransferase [Candidatus Lloydbacteria bacterium RIFCSPHIGHO2_01_FULL_49_22]OGZ09801.1 MAG: di-trans,poly-cis-decaprenylcistransferase [Candidatus Lloydbacteria bacterium RIFCSPHIGHO2_02_FULL_50_18]
MELLRQKNNLVPQSIAIIMDGNRRYAKAKGLPTLEGHRMGYHKLRDVLSWTKEAGINEIIVYAFSTENWNRTTEEVGYLMNLFREMIATMTKEAKEKQTRLIFLGERTRFAEDILQAIERAEQETRMYVSLTFGIALSYGGRTEIIDAIHRIPKEKLETISEDEFAQLLWTKEMCDPDLIIRTSGEERLSNFLPWQSVYSELVFTKTLWPDFSKEEFLSILKNYSERERRLGK